MALLYIRTLIISNFMLLHHNNNKHSLILLILPSIYPTILEMDIS